MKCKRVLAIVGALILLLSCMIVPVGAASSSTGMEYCIRLCNIVDGSVWITNGAIVGVDYDKDTVYIAADAALLDYYELEDTILWFTGSMLDSAGNLTSNYVECGLNYVTEDGMLAIYTTNYSAVEQYVKAFCIMADISSLEEGDPVTLVVNSPDEPYPANDWYSGNDSVVKVLTEYDLMVTQEYTWDDSTLLGASVVLDDGSCVGLTTLLIPEEGDPISCVKGFQEVIAFLDNCGATYVSSSESGGQSKFFLGSGIGLVVLAVVVILVVVIIKKRKKQAVAPQPQEIKMTPVPDNNVTIPNPGADNIVTIPNPVAKATPIAQTLKGLSGIHKNTEFPLVQPLIKIGRDATVNQIVLPSDAVAVSREHCYLQRSESGWVLVDTSSYGTTLNGKKMVRNQSYVLKNGDVFNFGQPPHSFTIN